MMGGLIMNLNKKIVIIILQLILVTGAVLLTLPLREELEAKTNKVKNGEYTSFKELPNLQLEVKDTKVDNLIPIKDEDALNSKSLKVKISNDNNTKGKYKLHLKYSKHSSVKTDWLKISIDGKIYKLNDLLDAETSDYKYYLIDENTLLANKNKTYEIIMWMDYNVGNEAQGTQLNYYYEIN